MSSKRNREKARISSCEEQLHVKSKQRPFHRSLFNETNSLRWLFSTLQSTPDVLHRIFMIVTICFPNCSITMNDGSLYRYDYTTNATVYVESNRPNVCINKVIENQEGRKESTFVSNHGMWWFEKKELPTISAVKFWRECSSEIW